ncbi:MAG: hypothetical protein KAS02_01370 [Candidatus Pacebacteria bacterium]|nr:hypothetical protein [Candidatus Paceibacterota bacterium]
MICKKIKKIKLFNFFLIILATFLITITSVKAVEYTLLEQLPGIPAVVGGESNLGMYLKGMFELVIGVASVLAVLMIVLGGFKYIISEAVTSTTAAKKQIQDALLGLIMVLASWLILNTINTDLTSFNTNLDSIKLPTPKTHQVKETDITRTLKLTVTQADLNIIDNLKNDGVIFKPSGIFSISNLNEDKLMDYYSKGEITLQEILNLQKQGGGLSLISKDAAKTVYEKIISNINSI